MMRRMLAGGSRPLSALAIVIVLAGCHARPPAAKVLADVNGDKVTQGELASDMASNGRARSLEPNALRRAALEGLVDRKLLVQQARRQGLADGPAFAALLERLQEIALAQQVMSRWAAETPPPSLAEAEAFVAANPQMFGQRQIYVLDQIRTAAAGVDVHALAGASSLDAAETTLLAARRPYARTSATLDTRALTPPLARRIADLAPGQPLMSVADGVVSISAVRRAEPAPVPQAERLGDAMQALRRRAMQQTISRKLAALRAGAHVLYAPAAASGRALAGAALDDVVPAPSTS